MEHQAPRLMITRQRDVTVVELMDQKILDEGSIARIGEKLYALVAAGTPSLVLDFAEVAHMSSSALGMLITLHKRVREKDGRLWLCNIRPSIHGVFSSTRLDEVFTICDSRQAALDAAAS
jgi:anti-anti-sigma factor